MSKAVKKSATKKVVPKKPKMPKVDILYEDADIAALNKPAGIMVHGDGRSEGPFLTDMVVAHFPEAKGVGEPAHGEDGSELDRSGIVHRLDRDTSGVILIAKTKKGHSCLKQQFHDRQIKKKYLAFVWGDFSEKFGTIDRPIGRSSSDFRKWSAQRGARGDLRDAQTYWSRIAPIQLPNGDKFTLVEAEPKTGRTHQIRVHFMAEQHPVVGDTLYAPKKPQALGFTRTALHAHSIEFLDCAGKRVKVEAPFPKDFLAAAKLAGIKLPASSS